MELPIGIRKPFISLHNIAFGVTCDLNKSEILRGHIHV